MSVSTTSTDPVQTLIDILDGTGRSTWSQKPTYIEKFWDTSRAVKGNRSDLAVYIYSPERSEQRQFGRNADTKIQTETIDAVVLSPDESEATDAASDVSAILEDYWQDKKSNTAWNRIQPNSTDDRRAETLPLPADHYAFAIRVTLERETDLGTS